MWQYHDGLINRWAGVLDWVGWALVVASLVFNIFVGVSWKDRVISAQCGSAPGLPPRASPESCNITQLLLLRSPATRTFFLAEVRSASGLEKNPQAKNQSETNKFHELHK